MSATFVFAPLLVAMLYKGAKFPAALGEASRPTAQSGSVQPVSQAALIVTLALPKPFQVSLWRA